PAPRHPARGHRARRTARPRRLGGPLPRGRRGNGEPCLDPAPAPSRPAPLRRRARAVRQARQLARRPPPALPPRAAPDALLLPLPPPGGHPRFAPPPAGAADGPRPRRPRPPRASARSGHRLEGLPRSRADVVVRGCSSPRPSGCVEAAGVRRPPRLGVDDPAPGLRRDAGAGGGRTDAGPRRLGREGAARAVLASLRGPAGASSRRTSIRLRGAGAAPAQSLSDGSAVRSRPLVWPAASLNAPVTAIIAALSTECWKAGTWSAKPSASAAAWAAARSPRLADTPPTRATCRTPVSRTASRTAPTSASTTACWNEAHTSAR